MNIPRGIHEPSRLPTCSPLTETPHYHHQTQHKHLIRCNSPGQGPNKRKEVSAPAHSTQGLHPARASAALGMCSQCGVCVRVCCACSPIRARWSGACSRAAASRAGIMHNTPAPAQGAQPQNNGTSAAGMDSPSTDTSPHGSARGAASGHPSPTHQPKDSYSYRQLPTGGRVASYLEPQQTGRSKTSDVKWHA